MPETLIRNNVRVYLLIQVCFLKAADELKCSTVVDLMTKLNSYQEEMGEFRRPDAEVVLMISR